MFKILTINELFSVACAVCFTTVDKMKHKKIDKQAIKARRLICVYLMDRGYPRGVIDGMIGMGLGYANSMSTAKISRVKESNEYRLLIDKLKKYAENLHWRR